MQTSAAACAQPRTGVSFRGVPDDVPAIALRSAIARRTSSLVPLCGCDRPPNSQAGTQKSHLPTVRLPFERVLHEKVRREHKNATSAVVALAEQCAGLRGLRLSKRCCGVTSVTLQWPLRRSTAANRLGLVLAATPASNNEARTSVLVLVTSFVICTLSVLSSRLLVN